MATHTPVDLSWTGPDIVEADGDLEVDSFLSNGSAIIHYEIQMWNSDLQSSGRASDVRVLDAHLSFEHSVTGRADTRYVYRVRAQNRAPANNGFGSNGRR